MGVFDTDCVLDTKERRMELMALTFCPWHRSELLRALYGAVNIR